MNIEDLLEFEKEAKIPWKEIVTGTAIAAPTATATYLYGKSKGDKKKIEEQQATLNRAAKMYGARTNQAKQLYGALRRSENLRGLRRSQLRTIIRNQQSQKKGK